MHYYKKVRIVETILWLLEFIIIVLLVAGYVYSFSARRQTNNCFPAIILIGVAMIILLLLYLHSKHMNYPIPSKELMTLIADMIESRVPFSIGHGHRVSCYARMLAKELRLPKRQITQLEAIAHLHDLGQIRIPIELFYKKEKLLPEELVEFQRVPQITYEILSRFQIHADILKGIRHLRERYDGTGYPDGLAGRKIPLFSRIIAIAEAFDALTSYRPYRHIYSPEEAIAIMDKESGLKYDPVVLESFKRARLKHEAKSRKSYPNVAGDILPAPETSQNKILMMESKTSELPFLQRHIKLQTIAYYRQNTIQVIFGKLPGFPTLERSIINIGENALQRKELIQQLISNSTQDHYYLIYAIPFTSQEVVIFILNLAGLMNLEEEYFKRERRVYRQLIYAATQRRLILAERDEFQRIVHDKKIRWGARIKITAATDIAKIRSACSAILARHQIQGKDRSRCLLAISEAATNAYKHASYGEVSLAFRHQSLFVLVSDQGVGIDFSWLPEAILTRGSSTKDSLGQGFFIMLNCSDEVILTSSAQGTELLLRFDFYEPKYSFANGILVFNK